MVAAKGVGAIINDKSSMTNFQFQAAGCPNGFARIEN
jgi:hypothetical protein